MVPTLTDTLSRRADTGVIVVADTHIYRVRIAALQNPEIFRDIDLEIGKRVEVEGMELFLRAVAYYPNYVWSFERREAENISDSPINPGLRIEMITEHGRLPLFWVFQRRPDFRPFARMQVRLIFLGRIPEHSL